MKSVRGVRSSVGAGLLVLAVAAAVLVFLNAGSGPTRASGFVIYNNGTSQDQYLPLDHIPGSPSPPQVILDWSTSPGGTVESFEIGYATGLAGPISLDIAFYTGTNETTDGTGLFAFPLTGLPGSSSPPNVEVKFYPVEGFAPFELPPGEFGYHYDIKDDSTGPILSTGDPNGQDLYRLTPQNVNHDT